MENREWLALAFWLIWLFQGNMSTDIPQEYKPEIFEARKQDEWKNYWHIEKYQRCYYQIPNHVELACKYDIYKVPVDKRKASKQILFKNFQKPDEYLPIYLIHGFGTKKRNGRKRRGAGGIVQECCKKTNGCSWEEYAEYCPGHNRRRGGESLLAEN